MQIDTQTLSLSYIHTHTHAHRLDTADKIKKQLLPTLDVDFLQGEEFKSFYRFAFLFSLEGTRRNIGEWVYIHTHTHTHTHTHSHTERAINVLSLWSTFSPSHLHTHSYTNTHTQCGVAF